MTVDTTTTIVKKWIAKTSLFCGIEFWDSPYRLDITKINQTYFPIIQNKKENYFKIHNRRYLGNKYKLLWLIEHIISKKCWEIESFCDIFAGTGVVWENFNTKDIKIISNDFLHSNYTCLNAFLGTTEDYTDKIIQKIDYLNNLEAKEENYFSKHFGNAYFSIENAKKIWIIRKEIEKISENDVEKNILICSLLYAVDKVANTVGHYDAFRKRLDSIQPIKLQIPEINNNNNIKNNVYKEDANLLIRKISCDVLYIDPPYNSRQYGDAYHLLENLSEWKKPKVIWVAKKMDRSHIKSAYCLKNATQAFEDLIRNANCKHILLSYNNTWTSKDNRSNARINDENIIRILKNRWDVEIFESDYKAFSTGKSNWDWNAERIFYCKVIK